MNGELNFARGKSELLEKRRARNAFSGLEIHLGAKRKGFYPIGIANFVHPNYGALHFFLRQR